MKKQVDETPALLIIDSAQSPLSVAAGGQIHRSDWRTLGKTIAFWVVRLSRLSPLSRLKGKCPVLYLIRPRANRHNRQRAIH
jgi:hypothetical protein